MSSESTANETVESLDQIRQLVKEGQIEKSLALLKTYWLRNPDDGEAADLLSNLMKESGRSELSERLSRLAKQLGESPDDKENDKEDESEKEKSEEEKSEPGKISATSLPEKDKPRLGPQELFEAGFSLIDARQHELAAMLLKRANTMVPEEPVINYELGFALMSSKRFEQAIAHFETAVKTTADFDTLLNLTACYTMVRRLDDAKRTLERIDNLKLDEEQSREIAHRRIVLRRLQKLKGKSRLNTRDWLYALYGSILLRPGAPVDTSLREDAATIGSMLAVLKGVLEGLRCDPETIEFYGPQSRPLVRAMGEFFEKPFGGYKGAAREERALLTMTWASDLIGPHQSFVDNQYKRAMFAYALSWNEPLPLVPEIIGCFSFHDPMPWDETGRRLTGDSERNILAPQEFERAVEEKYKAILDAARDVESEPHILRAVQEALDFYIGKEDLLVLANSKAFPRRSEYTAEVLA